MVQVDVFWSYGIGAGFAFAAKQQLQKYEPTEENGGWLTNPYFTRNLLYLALLFAPSGLYLLWQHTQWETMQALDKDMPGWLVTGFAITNITQGLLGFWVTYKLIRAGRDYLAFLQPILGYFCMFIILVHGWDGQGYQRFFSEDRATFLTWTPDHILTWLTSSVAITLGVMGLVLIPAMLGWMLKFAREGARLAHYPRDQQASFTEYLALLLTMIFGVVLGSAILASVLMHKLGTVAGAGTFLIIAALGIAGPRGILHWYFRRIDMDARSARVVAPAATAPGLA